MQHHLFSAHLTHQCRGRQSKLFDRLSHHYEVLKPLLKPLPLLRTLLRLLPTLLRLLLTLLPQPSKPLLKLLPL